MIKTLFVACYILSILFLLLGLCGLFGSIKAKRKSKLAPCLLSAYLVSVIFFFFVFLTMTIVMFAAPPAVFGESCDKGSSTKVIESLYNLNEDAKQNYCSDSCPCFLNSSNVNSTLWNWLQVNNRNVTTDSSLGYPNFRSCLKSVDDEANGVLLGSLEDFLGCSGWCSNDAARFLRFSDINFCTSESNL